MRKIVSILVLVLSNIVLFGQTFEYNPIYNESLIGTQVGETTDGSLIVTSVKFSPNSPQPWTDSYLNLTKLNHLGQLVNNVELPNDTFATFETSVIYEANYFVVLSTGNNIFLGYPFVMFQKFDYDLNLLEEYRNYVTFYPITLKFRKDGDDYIAAGTYNLGQTTPLKPYILKINRAGKITYEKIPTSGWIAYDIIPRTDSLGYLLVGSSFTFLDTSLAVRYRRSANELSAGDTHNILHLSDSTYLTSGRQSGNLATITFVRDIAIAVRNSQLGIISHTYFGAFDTIDYPAFLKSVDFKNQNNIYCGGTINVAVNGTQVSSDPSYFILANFNNNLQKKWEKRYGGDAYYIMFGLFATADSGCIMVGYRYDFNTDNRLDLYVLKVDGQGEVLTSTIIPTEGSTEVAFNIFPNPFQVGFSISTAYNEPLSLRLFDASGRLIVQKQFEREIYLQENIPSGVYFYHLQDENGKILKTGKVVKQ